MPSLPRIRRTPPRPSPAEAVARPRTRLAELHENGLTWIQLDAPQLEEAQALGSENGVEVVGETVRARSIGEAIVHEARRRDVDLIVLGSAPRWRRQSRFFSPTVDYVLKKAPAEVLIVAFPQGVLEGDGAGQEG